MCNFGMQESYFGCRAISLKLWGFSCIKSHAQNQFLRAFLLWGLFFRRHRWLQCWSRRNPSSAPTANAKLRAWNLAELFPAFQPLPVPDAVRWTHAPSETQPSSRKNSWPTRVHTWCVLYGSTASRAATHKFCWNVSVESWFTPEYLVHLVILSEYSPYQSLLLSAPRY